MLDHSCENELNLHVDENLSSYVRMSPRTRFVKEAEGNSEMGDLNKVNMPYKSKLCHAEKSVSEY